MPTRRLRLPVQANLPRRRGSSHAAVCVSERVSRAAPFVPHGVAQKPDEALKALIDDPDPTVAALARLHAVAIGRDLRPDVKLGVSRLLADSLLMREAFDA